VNGVVAVVSDTHRQLRPQLLESIADADLILHAGDIGSPAVIDGLSAIAPTIAIRGNIDRDPWANDYPETVIAEFRGLRAFLIHDVNTLSTEPNNREIDLVVSGHSHKPAIEQRNGMCYLNPGSVGPRRFRLPIAFARLELENSDASPATVLCQLLVLAGNDAAHFQVTEEHLIELNHGG
jgi:putative phosphoesterase